jgi:heme exporter protein B
MKLFKALFWRDCQLCFRQSGDYLLALSFWFLFVCFFPLTNIASPQLLQSFAPGIIWLGLLLTQLLNLSKLFRDDYQDGVFAELLQSPHELFLMVLFKLVSFWIIFYLPISLLAPVLASMFHLSPYAIFILEVSILLGSPILTLLSAFVSSLTLTIRNNNLIINLLFLPLTVPILIFSTSAVNRVMLGLSCTAPLAWLGVILLLSLAIMPVAITYTLKTIFE